MRYAAIIPGYNVEESIGKVVKRTLPFVNESIVIDDGSMDNTAKEAKKHGAKVISLETNTGKANALRAGIQECEDFDAVVFLDGDLQHCPEEIPKLFEEVNNGADLCIGSRFYGDYSNMPLGNRITNTIISRLISGFSGHRLTDVQSGFRAFDSEKLSQLELKAERYSIEHIMVLEAAKKKMRIKEVPISCMYGCETSNIKAVSDTLRVTYDVARFILR